MGFRGGSAGALLCVATTGAKSQGEVVVPLTSTGLAHKGHDPARGQCEGEVFEDREAGAAGVTGRSQDTLSHVRFPGPG